MRLWAGIEINLTCYSGKTPKVLVLSIRTVTPAHYLHANQVLLSWFQVACQVKFYSILRILAIPNLMPVDP